MTSAEKLLTAAEAKAIFELNDTDLRTLRALSLNGTTALYLVDLCRLFIKNKTNEMIAPITPSLLSEEHAAAAVGLSSFQLSNLRKERTITPPAFTQISGVTEGRGKRVYLYDLAELTKQIKAMNSEGIAAQWEADRAAGKAIR
ncbi:hypothetical protein AGMMS50229_08750 [Campylobacterota bacterium]|nr:hypothetical protein AGMMS50229_08750 [Campylobacterota bacterium]